MRTDWHTYFLDIALRCAQQGTCLRRNRGAIIVNEDRRIIATGYSGAPQGEDHCTSCLREQYNIQPGTHYELCHSIHAEMNALLQAGDKAKGCTLYLAGININNNTIINHDAPCLLCSKLIVQQGIKSVIILQPDNGFIEVHPRALLKFRTEEMCSMMLPIATETPR